MHEDKLLNSSLLSRLQISDSQGAMSPERLLAEAHPGKTACLYFLNATLVSLLLLHACEHHNFIEEQP